MIDRHSYLSKLIEFVLSLTASKYGFIFRYNNFNKSVDSYDIITVRNKIQGNQESINIEHTKIVINSILNQMICYNSFNDFQDKHNGEITNTKWLQEIDPTWSGNKVYFSIFPIRVRNEIIGFFVMLRDIKYDHFINQNTLFPLLLKIGHDLQAIDTSYSCNSGATIC